MFPYLIAGAIGFAVAKIFESDETPKLEEGGDIDYSNFRTSVIGLVNDNKVLILQRGSTANWMPNKWSIVGGVIEEGEVPIEAMIRECEEEIGLEPSNVSYDHKIMTTDSGEIYYFVGTLGSTDVKLDYENSAYKFISKDEIDNYDFVPYIKEFILSIFSRNTNKPNNHFADGGSVLLAPNGNPSYLTPEQYKLVRTPAFKEWFGDWEKAYQTGNYDNISKVIGYNMKGFSGEPLICSHSSYDKFNQFKTPTFFQEGEDGGAYGDTSDEDYVNYNVFLNIKNPLELRGAFLKDKFTPLISEIYKNAGLDDDEYKNRMEFAEKYKDVYGLFKLFEKPYWKNERGYNWEWVFDYCKKNGYDGFVMRDSDQSMQYYITTWVALYPEQIKLADGTNTTFDGSNPDIRFDNGGEITTYTEFYDNLQIEDGSKYIGQKFSEVFPFLGRRKTPNDFRILLKQYYGIVKRMEEDDYSTKAMKKTDLNKFKSSKSNIDKKKYLAGFYLDSNGIITKFVK